MTYSVNRQTTRHRKFQYTIYDHHMESSHSVYEHDKCTNRIFLWLYSASVIYVRCIWCLNAQSELTTALTHKTRTYIKHIDPCRFQWRKIILRPLWVSRFFHLKWFMNVRIEKETLRLSSIVIHSYIHNILFAPSSFSSPFDGMLKHILCVCAWILVALQVIILIEGA